MPSPKICIARGFTLIEILVVVAIFTILASLGLFMTMDAYRATSSRSERDIVVSLLEQARSRAMNNYEGTTWGVCYLAPNYEIFSGNDCAAGSSRIIFSQLAGTTTAIDIPITQNGRTDIISINHEGTINW